MKIYASCIECQKELGHPSFEPIFADYDNNLVVKVKCSRGHESNMILQATKFELFLDCGADALVKGYALESCFNFALARENAFLFAIEIMMENTLSDKYKNFLKSSSERVFGAFTLLYLREFNRPFEFEKKFSFKNGGTIVNFRNDIVHKGFIPTIAQANSYGEIVHNEVFELVAELRQKFSKPIQDYICNQSTSRYEACGYKNCSITANSTMFSLSRDNNYTFIQAMESFQKWTSSLDDAIPELKKLFQKVQAQYRVKES